jgi:peptide/nickel transport system substrate-binding protein
VKAHNKWLTAPLAAGLAAALLSGCGEEKGGDAGGSGGSVIVGMSDEVLATDPAAGYDPGSWLLFNNVFQSLLSFPKGASVPQPEAADKCGFDQGGSKVYRCTLRDGLKFSNGNPLTSEDVKFSFERAEDQRPGGTRAAAGDHRQDRHAGRQDRRLHPEGPRRHLPEQDRLGCRLHRRPP